MVHPLKTVEKGKYIIRGSLKYQACDNSACYPPKNLPISFDVKIAKAQVADPGEPRSESRTHTNNAFPLVGLPAYFFGTRSFLKTFPSFITNPTFSRILMFSSGSPAMATTSA